MTDFSVFQLLQIVTAKTAPIVASAIATHRIANAVAASVRATVAKSSFTNL